jgi:transcriptional regulator with XRE-family HTH domain
MACTMAHRNPWSRKPVFVRGTNTIDICIGERIRERRMLLGMNLDALGKALGVSYQQVQKYEVGINRVSASILATVAAALGVPISFFFEDPQSEEENPAAPQRLPRDLMERPETLRWVRLYYAIRDENVRSRALMIVEAIAEASAPLSEAPPSCTSAYIGAQIKERAPMRKPNYRFERAERDRLKAGKNKS